MYMYVYVYMFIEYDIFASWRFNDAACCSLVEKL